MLPGDLRLAWFVYFNGFRLNKMLILTLFRMIVNVTEVSDHLNLCVSRMVVGRQPACSLPAMSWLGFLSGLSGLSIFQASNFRLLGVNKGLWLLDANQRKVWFSRGIYY